MSTANFFLCSISCTPPPPSLALLHGRPTAAQWAIPGNSRRLSGYEFLKLNGRRAVDCCAFGAVSGDSDGPWRIFVEGMDIARKMFDGMPLPVKSFNWAGLGRNFISLVLELVVAVVKYLSVPLLAISSLSEMSYCAHERKMWLIPVPFLFGLAVAGVFKDAAEELSSEIKAAGFPWHLILIGSFFALLKLPGPYYPYWGRLLIPHFANGGLWRTAWLLFMWYRRPLMKSGESAPSI